jgi:uncharacterized membrane protein
MMATEIGMTSKNDPVFITSFKGVRKGISGAVSFLGILSSFLGSILVAGLFILFNIYIISNALLTNALFILIGGFFVSILDSILGSLLQASYIDYKTGLVTEIPTSNDIDNRQIKGIKSMGNEFVIFMSLTIVSLIYVIIRMYS